MTNAPISRDYSYFVERYANARANTKCEYLKTNYRTIDVSMYNPYKCRWLAVPNTENDPIVDSLVLLSLNCLRRRLTWEATLCRLTLGTSISNRVMLPTDTSAPAQQPKSFYSVSNAILWPILFWWRLLFDFEWGISNKFIRRAHLRIYERKGFCNQSSLYYLNSIAQATGNGLHLIYCAVVSSVLNLLSARNAVVVVPTAFYLLSWDHHQLNLSSSRLRYD